MEFSNGEYGLAAMYISFKMHNSSVSVANCAYKVQ
jgi:hypothetical protein